MLKLATLVPEIREMAEKDLNEATEGLDFEYFDLKARGDEGMKKIARINFAFTRHLRNIDTQSRLLPKIARESAKKDLMVRYGMVYCKNFNCYVQIETLDYFLEFVRKLKQSQ